METPAIEHFDLVGSGVNRVSCATPEARRVSVVYMSDADDQEGYVQNSFG